MDPASLRAKFPVLTIQINDEFGQPQQFTARRKPRNDGDSSARAAGEAPFASTSTNTNCSYSSTLAYSAPTYATQTPPVGPKLRALSQPRNAGSFEQFPNYVYRMDRVRNETFIYHAELGINTHHEDFQERRIEWLFTPRAELLGQDTKDETPGQQFGYSTCTASKGAGRIYGAPKGATLVVVKMPDFKRESVKEVQPHILDHIQHESRNGVSVVSISWNSRQLVPDAPLGIVLSEMYSTFSHCY